MWIEDSERGVGYMGREIDVGESGPGDRYKHKHELSALGRMLFICALTAGDDSTRKYFDAIDSMLANAPKEPYVEHEDYRDVQYEERLHGVHIAVSFIELMQIALNLNPRYARTLLSESENKNVREMAVQIRKDIDSVYSDRGESGVEAFIERIFMDEVLALIKSGVIVPGYSAYKIIRSPVRQKRIVVMDHEGEKKAVHALCDLLDICGEKEHYSSVVMKQVKGVWEMPIVNLPMFTAYLKAFKAQLLTEKAVAHREHYDSDNIFSEDFLKFSSQNALVEVNIKIYSILARQGNELE